MADDTPKPQLNIDTWAQGIAEYESGGNPNARNYRNNNPGNLKYRQQYGATGVDEKGFAVFQSPELGMKALKGQLELNLKRNPNFTLAQHMHHYLGGTGEPKATGEGDPIAYANFLSKKMGIDAGSTLGANTPTVSGARPWKEIASQFDPMMPEDTYNEIKKHYFDNFIFPHLDRNDDPGVAWKYFDEKTTRPKLLNPDSQMKLHQYNAELSLMHGAMAATRNLDPGMKEQVEGIERKLEVIHKLQQREGQNPALESIPLEMAGASAPLMLLGEAAGAMLPEDLIAAASLTHRALKGGMTFAAYEAGETTDKNKGVAALKGFAIGATLDAGLSLPGKLLRRGVEGKADELLRDALNAEKGVGLDADRAMSDYVVQDQQLAKEQGRSAFLRETHNVRGAHVEVKLPDGRVITEPILPDKLEEAHAHIQFFIQQGGEVQGINFQPGWLGKVQEFLALQNKTSEVTQTSKLVSVPPGSEELTSLDMRVDGHPAEPVGEGKVAISNPKPKAPSRDMIREKIADFGGDENVQQNLINQIRQIWEPKVPAKSKRVMVDTLEATHGTQLNDLLPEEWKVKEKVNGIYKSEFQQWMYSLGGMQGRHIQMAHSSWEMMMNSSEGPAGLKEFVQDIEKWLPKGTRLPERFLPMGLAPKTLGEVEAVKAIGGNVPLGTETLPTLDIEESRSSKVGRLYNVVTQVGFGRGDTVEKAERILTSMGLDPAAIDVDELAFAPSAGRLDEMLKSEEILQSAQDEIASKARATGTDIEQASAMEEAARKGEFEPSAADKYIPHSEKGHIVLTDSGPKFVYLAGNHARIAIRLDSQSMEKLFPGAAHVVVPPGIPEYEGIINRLQMGLDPNDTRPLHLAPTVNRDFVWHENMHIGIFHAGGGDLDGLGFARRVMQTSNEFDTAARIASKLMDHTAYKNISGEQMIEEAFVHSATAVRTGNTQYLAQLAYWDTSVGRVLSMVEDMSKLMHDMSFQQADTVPIRSFRRQLEYVIGKSSSNRMGELMNQVRGTSGTAFYEPVEGNWKFITEDGRFTNINDYNKLIDHVQDISSGQDFAPSASLWAELRGVKGQFIPRGLEPTKDMPMPEHTPGPENKWLGWKAIEGAFRPMLPWVADVDTKINEVFSRKGQHFPIYDRVKAVDEALKSGDEWLTNNKELAADFLKGNPKQLYAYMDVLTQEQKHWPDMMQKVGLGNEHLPNLQRAEQWLKDYQNDTHIPAFNYLRDQLPRLRGFNFNTEFVYGRGAKLPSDMSFFHRSITEGSLDPKDAHLGRFINYLIREGFEKKFTSEPIQQLKKLVDLKDAEDKYVLGAMRWPLNNYVNYVRGIPDLSQQVITRASGDFSRMLTQQFKKVNPYLPEGFKLPEEVNYPGSIFQKLMTLSYVGSLGARPAIFIRDVFQAATTTLPVLGFKNFIKGATRGLTREGFERAEAAGALLNKQNVGEMYGDIFNEMPASGNKFDAALKLSSKLLAPSRWGHNVARAIAYNGEFDSVVEAVNKYRAGSIDAHDLLTETSMWFYDKPEINRLLRDATSPHVPVEEVAHRSALQLVDLTLWPYRRGAQPTLLRTGAGRIFGQFGMWPLNYMDFLRRLGSKVGEFHGPALRTIATWGASNYAAASTLEGMFHADVGKWFWLSPSGFGGSPHMEMVQNLMKSPEETQDGREARRKVLEYPMNFVPTSNEIKSIMKSMEEGGPAFTDDGHLSDNFTRILGFRPLNEVHEENMKNMEPADRLRYEFGYKKEKK